MNKTDIAWTTFTANPLKYRRKSDGAVVWACVKVSPGCRSCYAEAIALRWERGKLFNAANMEELEPFLDEAELRKMLTAKTIGGVPVSGSRVFVGDMTDMLGAWVPDEMLDRLFAVFALRSDVTFQVLTKRAERMRDYFADEYRWAFIEGMAQKIHHEQTGEDPSMWLAVHDLPNVWLGVSVEDQQRADERIPLLLQTPAAVRFLSVEPLLGAVNLMFVGGGQTCTPYQFRGNFWEVNCENHCEWVGYEDDLVPDPDQSDADADESGTIYVCPKCHSDSALCYRDEDDPKIDWVIVGGESGPNRRECQVDWIRSIREQCRAAGVPCFIKQDSGPRPGMQGRIPLDVWAAKEFPR